MTICHRINPLSWCTSITTGHLAQASEEGVHLVRWVFTQRNCNEVQVLHVFSNEHYLMVFYFSTIDFSGSVPYIPRCWDRFVMVYLLYGILNLCKSYHTNFAQAASLSRIRETAMSTYNEVQNHQASASFRFLGSLDALLSLVLFWGSKGSP